MWNCLIPQDGKALRVSDNSFPQAPLCFYPCLTGGAKGEGKWSSGKVRGHMALRTSHIRLSMNKVQRSLRCREGEAGVVGREGGLTDPLEPVTATANCF